MLFKRRSFFLLIAGIALAALPARAQDRLKLTPAYDRYERLSRETGDSVKGGSVSVTWSENEEAIEFRKEGKRFKFDIPSKTLSELTTGQTNQSPGQAGSPPTRNERARRRQSGPARARQFSQAVSPDGKWKAVYRDYNLWLADAKGTNQTAITTDGSRIKRIKYGTANWVYGEELFQSTAMWWSSNSQKVAFYRFDETQVPDYFMALNQTNIQDTLYVEPYNKAGATNPIVDILVYDLETKSTVTLDVRSGQPCDNSVPGHYVYGVSWSPHGDELLFHRADRLQKVMELCAADAVTGKCRVIVHEEWAPSWVENTPEMRFLKDGHSFIWASERNGWKNYYVYDLSGLMLRKLTQNKFEAGEIARVDERHQRLYYTARSGDNPMKLQLHCAALDGGSERRLTDPAFNHSVDVSPNGDYFIDTFQTHDTPPVTCLRNGDGQLITELARSDTSKFAKLGLKKVELFEFKADDDQTALYGMLHFPSNFSPHKKYPLLVTVYAGPATSGASETFTLPNAVTELGFLVAALDSRSANGRGKKFLDVIYQNLGKVEIDDQAAGVKALAARRYVDPKRVGIFGTSYGGTASLLCLMRYPEVFQAACACSAVTDFRNYDTIYTERYFGLPQEHPIAYDQVCAMNYVNQLKGRLMLYYGTADDNVHPSNTLQLVKALQHAGKSFELQVGPDAGHSSVNRDRMMEFFIDALTR